MTSPKNQNKHSFHGNSDYFQFGTNILFWKVHNTNCTPVLLSTHGLPKTSSLKLYFACYCWKLFKYCRRKITIHWLGNQIIEQFVTMAGLDMGALMSEQLMQAAAIVEDQIDAEMAKMEKLPDEDEMEVT